MKNGRVYKIDFSRKRLGERAEKYYHERDYLSALRFTYKELSLYGGSANVYARLADIYENMGLNMSAINVWFKFMDECDQEDLPDIYEGLAVNYLNAGNEAQSAFYYNKLIDEDDTLTEENKAEIVDAFAKEKRSLFRFVYPPRLADYSKETEMGSRALKCGDCNRAISILSVVEDGSPDYEVAREMQAVAHLLSDNADEAEKICLELIEKNPQNVQAIATLAAVYVEKNKSEESKALAHRLYEMKLSRPEEIYKVATVCCENGLHREALEKFNELEAVMPYDGNMLYFKAVAAFESGNEGQAEDALDRLYTIYPDASVAAYYLKEIRRYREDPSLPRPQTTYFYRVPQAERERRCRSLVNIGKASKEQAEIFGLLAEEEGLFAWCFDEMDGMDGDLQYLAVVVAEHSRADGFLRDVLLDSEISDVLKIELLRILYLRNEENSFGVVICNIYREAALSRIVVGAKKRKKFVEAHAKLASKFAVIQVGYGERIKKAMETLYRAVSASGAWELVENPDDLCCAVYLICGFKEMGRSAEQVVSLFEAEGTTVSSLLETYQKFTVTEKK